MDARFATSRKNGPEGPGTIEGCGKYSDVREQILWYSA